LIDSFPCFWKPWLTAGGKLIIISCSPFRHYFSYSAFVTDDHFICSSSDELCHRALVSIIETVPVKDFVFHVVSKVLKSCIKLSQKIGDSAASESGIILTDDLICCFAFTSQV
jgi:hypothetical protein